MLLHYTHSGSQNHDYSCPSRYIYVFITTWSFKVKIIRRLIENNEYRGIRTL